MAVFWIQRKASGSVRLELLLEHALGAIDALRVSSRSARSATSASAARSSANRLTAISIAGTSRTGERLDQVGHRPGVPRPLDEVALAERGEHHDGAIRSPTIHAAAAIPSTSGIFTSRITRSGRCSLGQLDGGGTVTGLTDDVVPLLGQHLCQVHPDEDLVLGHHDGAGGGRVPRRSGRRSGLGHARRLPALALALISRTPSAPRAVTRQSVRRPVSSATACATSARSTHRREHSTAAARAFSNARPLARCRQPPRMLTERNCSERLDFCQPPADPASRIRSASPWPG